MLAVTLLRTFLLIYSISAVKCNVKTSLVFAIDSTGSMGDDIDQVIEASVEILKIAVEDKLSKIENFVLITFNDPDVQTISITKDPGEYYNALRSLQVGGGDDCPEMAMAGIERALEQSLPGSFIYVFTDASAKDHDRVEAIKKLAHKKQSKVIFLLTGMCLNEGRGTLPYQVYHDVAAVSSGQVFHLRKDEVAKVLKSVSLLITGNSSVLTSKHLPEGCHEVSFSVDSKTTDISISVSGENVLVSGITGNNIDPFFQESIVETNDVYISKLHGPSAGNYSMTVCSNIGSTVMIAGVTDLDFQYGFAYGIPNSLADTDIQPTIGRRCRLAIELSNPDNDIELHLIEILDLFENILFEVPCQRRRDNFYVTDELTPPSFTFKIAVVGYDKIAGTPVKRISKTAIQPITPKEKIENDLERTPKILDITRKNNTYDATKKNDPIDENGTTGKNIPLDRNTPTDKNERIDENVTTGKNVPLDRNPNIETNDTIDENVTTGKYVPLDRNPTIENTDPADVTAGINVPLDRNSTIEKNDPIDENVTTTAKNNEIEMEEMKVPPKLDKSTTLGRLNPGTSIIMECPLVQGNPKPKITWYYKLKGSSDYEEIKNVGESFPLLVNVFDNNSVYRCNVDNEEGHDYKEFVLRVNKRPSIAIPEEMNNQVSAGKTVELPCKVRGDPKPKVKWTRKGKDLSGDKYKILKDNTLRFVAEPSDSDKYMCIATNEAGTTRRTIKVKVMK